MGEIRCIGYDQNDLLAVQSCDICFVYSAFNVSGGLMQIFDCCADEEYSTE